MKRIFFGIILLFCYFVIFNSETKAWYSNDYDFRLPIVLNNSLNSEKLNDYQVKITLTSEQADFWSRIESDGSDIRFVDSDDLTLLDFWLKNFNYEENLAEIWVQIPNISALSSKTIYLYFGNLEAQALNSFEATMELEPLNFFTKNYDSERGNDQAISAKFLSTGEMVVAGNYINSSDNNDWRVAKYSKNGDLIWAKNFGFTTGEVKDLAIDIYDNILAVGYYEITGNKNWYIRKYDKDGNILWSKTYDSGGNDEANTVAIDDDENIIVGGYSTDGDKNWYIRKYNAMGGLISDFDYDSELGDDILDDLAVDSENNIVATGNSATLASRQFYTMKLDSNFVEEWNSSYEKGTADSFRAIDLDSSGNIFLGGYYNEADNNWLLRKLDADGNLEWDRLYDSENGDDFLYGLAVNSLDEIIVTGSSASLLGTDLLIRKYSNDGDIDWSNLEDNSLNESFFGLDFNDNDDFVLAGFYTDNLDYDWLISMYGERKYTALEPDSAVGLFEKIAVKTFDKYIRFNNDSQDIKYVSKDGVVIKFLSLPDKPTRFWLQINKVKKIPNFLDEKKSLRYHWKLVTNLYKKSAGKFKMKMFFPYTAKKIKKADLKEKKIALYSKNKSYINEWEKKKRTELKKMTNFLQTTIKDFSGMRNWFAIAEK